MLSVSYSVLLKEQIRKTKQVKKTDEEAPHGKDLKHTAALHRWRRDHTNCWLPHSSTPGRVGSGCCCRRAVAVTEGVGAGRLAVAAASDCGDAALDACLGDEFVQRGASSSVRPWSTSHPRRLTRRRAPPAPNSRGFFFF